jgi:hypothetical protein
VRGALRRPRHLQVAAPRLEGKIRKLVVYVKGHQKLHDQYYKISTELRLPNNTRFKGVHILLACACDNRRSLQQVVFTDPFEELLFSSKREIRDAADQVMQIIQDNNLWEAAAGIFTLTAPVAELVDFVNGEVRFSALQMESTMNVEQSA